MENYQSNEQSMPVSKTNPLQNDAGIFVILEVGNSKANAVRGIIEQDAEKLRKIADQLDFKILHKKSKGLAEASETLNKISLEIVNEPIVHQFICSILLSPGTNWTKLTEKGVWSILTQHFNAENCKTLIDKPKVFFIQVYERHSGQYKGLGNGSTNPIPIAVESEVFIILSSQEESSQTAVIDALQVELNNRNQKLDISKVFTKINSDLSKLEGFKPIYMFSRLTRPLILREGENDIALEHYDSMDNFEGIFVIFEMKPYNDLPTGGVERDAEKLCLTMEKFGFDCQIKVDLKKAEIIEYLDNVKSSQKDLKCFGCAILTHGDCDSLVTYDGKIERWELVNKVQGCGKYNFLLIGACKGSRRDVTSENIQFQTEGRFCYQTISTPYTVETTSNNEVASTDEAICNNASNEVYIDTNQRYDSVIANATTTGYVAYGSDKKGSPFIQSFCKELNDIQPEEGRELIEILTKVNYEVGSMLLDEKYEPTYRKQMPSFCSTLRKKLMLKMLYTDDDVKLRQDFTNNSLVKTAKLHFSTKTVFEIYKKNPEMPYKEMYIKCHMLQYKSTREAAESHYEREYVNCKECNAKPATKKVFSCDHEVFCGDCASTARTCAKPGCEDDVKLH